MGGSGVIINPLTGRRELVVDLFAGGGGASAGLRMATRHDPDIAINHCPEALTMHEANHPGTTHFQEDVFERCPRLVTGGLPVGVLWLSPTCTYYSKAKGGRLGGGRKAANDGGQRRRKINRVRALAWVAIRWARTVRPRIIMLENVVEFSGFGPTDIDGAPIEEKKGSLYKHFIRRLTDEGYAVDARILSAHDYGARTSRKRLFMIARCDGRPIMWPMATHGPGKEPYRTIAECIDWTLPCPSIFDRKKPLADATLRRVAKGVMKFIVNANNPFLAPGDQATGLSGVDRRGQVTGFIAKHYSGVTGHPLERPIGTITTVDHHSLVCASLMPSGGGEKSGLVCEFLTKHYGKCVGNEANMPLQMITCRGRFAPVSVAGEPHVIGDIGLRMLQPHELFAAQGFPDGYIIDPVHEGKRLSNTAQVRLCGNSVVPHIACALAKANLRAGERLTA